LDSDLQKEKEKMETKSAGRTEVVQRTNTYILILVFAEVIYSVDSLFFEIRKRPEKLDDIDSS